VGGLGGRARRRGVRGTIDVPAGSISYVVDPALRRHGYCAAMVSAVLAAPELEHIQLFAAGVEPANTGSVGCLRKAGFAPLNTNPSGLLTG
jgi:RimJ/RimL family protein N-acetyltransferase